MAARRSGCRRLLVVGAAVLGSALVLLVLLAVWVSRREHRAPVPVPSVTAPPTAAQPLGHDRLVFDSNRTGGYEIYAMSTAGSQVRQLTHDRRYDSWWARVSPDRRRILFYRTPRGTYDRDYGKTSLWMMDADGGHVTLLLPSGAYGWVVQGHAEWSPDGRRLVMFAGGRSSPQIVVTDMLGHQPKRLTHRGGVNIDPSWSPDGRRIAFIGCPGRICFPSDYEVYMMSAGGRQITRVTHDSIRDNDPAYSPDGRWIAWLSETSTKRIAGIWNIRLAHPDGSGLRLVTDDGNVNSKPEWSADGSLIYFHRLVYDAPRPHFGIWVIRPDGTGLRDLTSGQPGAAAYPST